MQTNRKRIGFTLVELIAVLVIVLVLIALLLPAVQQAREAARKKSCENNMKQIGLALHNYHDSHSTLPPGYIGMPNTKVGEGHWSWNVMIMPYMEASPNYSYLQVDKRSMQLALTDPIVLNSFQSLSPMNRCPSSEMPNLNEGLTIDGRSPNRRISGVELPATNYVGINSSNVMRRDPELAELNMKPATPVEYDPEDPFRNPPTPNSMQGTFYRNSQTRFRDFIDGTSNTIIVGERAWKLGKQRPQAAVMYGVVNDFVAPDGMGVTQGGKDRQDELANIARYDSGLAYSMAGGSAYINEKKEISRFGLSSQHKGGVFVLLGDGSVRFINEDIDHNPETRAVDSTFEILFCINDGPLLGDFE